MTAEWSIEVVSCKGSSYEVGQQMAHGFRKTPKGKAFKRRKERWPPAFDLKNAQVALEAFAPNIWEELHGLSDGLEISLERAAAEFSNGRLRYPLRGCSAVMTGGLYGRNYDFSPKRYDRILAVVQPDVVNASVGFSDRFTGRDDGMNEHGLCVGLHHVNEKNWKPGLVCILIVRIILDQCATTREAIDLLKRLPHGLGFNYSLIDAGGHAAVVEACPDAVAVREGSQLACTNHFQSPDLRTFNRRNPSSYRRLAPLEKWSREQPPAEDLFKRLNSSQSPVFEHGYASGSRTLHSMVCTPATQEMLVGVGGDACPYKIDVKHWAKTGSIDLARLTGQLGGTASPFDPAHPAGRGPAAARRAAGKAFIDANLSNAVFKDVSLANARFSDVNLAGAQFDDINLANVAITPNCNFKGMTIAGVSIADLFAAYKRDRSGGGS